MFAAIKSIFIFESAGSTAFTGYLTLMMGTNDNSVGQTISGSTGSPVISSGEAMIFDVDTGPDNLWDACFYYTKCGVDYGAGPPGFVRDCQFINDTVGIFDAPDGNPVLVENCLFSNIRNAVFSGVGYGNTINAANLTVHQAAMLVTNVTLSVTNSLFIEVTNWGGSFTGSYNATNGSDAGVFTSGPFGNDYLGTNIYRNVGTTAIDPALLADLRQTTTYTPAGGSYPDTDTPDLGFHYPIIGSTGTDFWIAFLNMYNDSDNVLSLNISSPVEATGTITVPGFGVTNVFSVAAGAVTNIDFDSSMIMSDFSEVETYGIHITTSQPVSVYALDYDPSASTGFTCYPTPLLQTNYCVMARPSLAGGSSEFGIVATVDNTTVTITPSPTADLDTYSGTNTYTLTNLLQGQSYQIQSSDETGDVTGTRITADKPIAVFAGANDAYVPDANTAALNPLMQEQLPVDAWGTNVVALSFAGRTGGDTYRILAANSNTVITIAGKVITSVDETNSPYTETTSNEVVVVTITNAGQFYDIIVDGPVEFQGSQSIQLAQFANGAGFDHPDNGEGDPCEILLPPTGHYLTSYIVYSPTNLISAFFGTFEFDQNHLNLIVAQTAITNTFVDGSQISSTNFVAIGSSGYYGSQISMTPGAHTVTSSKPVEVQVYGFGCTNSQSDAYSYFGGIAK